MIYWIDQLQDGRISYNIAGGDNVAEYKNFSITFREEDFEAVDNLAAEFVMSNKSMITREAIHFALENKEDFKAYLMKKAKAKKND